MLEAKIKKISKYYVQGKYFKGKAMRCQCKKVKYFISVEAYCWTVRVVKYLQN